MEITFKQRKYFKVGIKVIWMWNDDDIKPGDVGTIQEIDFTKKKAKIKFSDERIYEIPFFELKLATEE